MEKFEIKKGVNIKELKDEIKNILWKISLTCRAINGANYVMTVTSGNDGIHMEKSKHYTNEAIDIRRRDMINSEKTAKALQLVLGKNYDVILEETHIHIEYDPK